MHALFVSCVDSSVVKNNLENPHADQIFELLQKQTVRFGPSKISLSHPVIYN